MKYYIKTIGIENEYISIFQGRFSKMLRSNMCFKTAGQRVRDLQKGDKLVIYCIRHGVKEYPNGGFIGVLGIIKSFYPSKTIFGKPWIYIIDIQPIIEPCKNIISLKEVRRWGGKSCLLNKALRAHLQACGGLLPIEKEDYDWFLEKLKELRKE